MHDGRMAIPLWTRAVADPVFRDALIDDPLRALADAGDVTASPEQVAQLVWVAVLMVRLALQEEVLLVRRP